jgi:hypothetical protein
MSAIITTRFTSRIIAGNNIDLHVQNPGTVY